MQSLKVALLLALAATVLRAENCLVLDPEDPPAQVSWLAGPETAGPFVLASDGHGHLFRVAPDTGVTLDLGVLRDEQGEPIGGGLTDVAWDPAAGHAWAITFNALYALDPADPTRGRKVGDLGGGGMNALAVGPDGQLLGASNGGGVYQICRKSGDSHALFLLGSGRSSSGDLVVHRGEVLATSPGPEGGDQLLRLDLAQGTSTPIGTLTGPDGPETAVYGLVSRGGTLYALTQGGQVYAVDPGSAAMTTLGSTEVGFWGATAIELPADEP